MLLFMLMIFISFHNLTAQNFITKWSFSNSAIQLQFNALTAGDVNFTWSATPSGNSGSGSFNKPFAGFVTISSLNIAAGDVVTLSLSPSNLRRFYINEGSDRLKFIDIVQWGSVPWSSMAKAFAGCNNMIMSAVDVPNLSNVTDMDNMFKAAHIFNGNIANWDVSNISNMTGLFYHAFLFNQDISAWNVSNVTNMSFMFGSAEAFNQDIGGWNVSSVSNMSNMFNFAFSFNHQIGNWNVSNVLLMANMFSYAESFNHSLGEWHLNPNVTLGYLIGNSGMSCSTYSETLIGWQMNNPAITNRNINVQGVQFGTNAAPSRALLTNNQGWIILGDSPSGFNCSPCSLTVNATGLQTTCGLNDGTVTANPSGGSGYTFLWMPGNHSTQTVNNLAAGTYNVTVTASGGCTATASAIVGSSTGITTTASGTATTCGLNNGAVTANPGGGSGYTYLWTPGNHTSQTVNNLGAGTYNVTVTASGGCTATASAIVGSSTGITTTASGTATTCGLNNGAVTANPGGGSGYTYLWTPGNHTSQMVNNLGAGTYNVMVTATGGCTATASAMVNSSTGISTTANGTATTCGLNNGSVTATPSGGSGYTYLWTPGNHTSQTVNNLAAGTYNVTVTSANGCITTATATVNSSTAITVMSSVTNTTCGLNNGSATASASGGSGYIYNWSNGGNTATINNLAAGAYTVTVTSANGCTNTATATVNASAGISVITNVVHESCSNCDNGSATATAVGGSGYSYIWSNGGSTQMINNLAPGIYTVTVTSSNGCTATANAVINAFGCPSLNINMTKTDPTCVGNCNGIATAAGSGGQSPYTYIWSNGGTTQTLTGLCAGIYTVTVTDANQCPEVASVTLDPGVSISVIANGTNTSCGLNNGSVIANPAGGSGYTYLWMPGNYTTQTVNNLASGNYNVSVTSNNGCTATASAMVGSSTGISATASGTTTSCGQNNGSITATPTGGSGYAYLWMPGNYTTQTVNNLAAGTYNVTVTATGGCTSTASTFVNSSIGITTTANGNTTTCGQNNGSITATPTGGSGYTYLWMPGNYTTQTVNNLAAGTYSVTVTATGGCAATASAIVNSSTAITAMTSVTHESCNNCNDGLASVTPSGGSGYTYLWSNGGSSQAITGLVPGTYTVTVTSGGCSTTASAVVNSFGCPTINLTTTITKAVCFGQNGTAIVSPSGGAAPYTFQWSNNGTTAMITAAAGIYTVLVTDKNGCANSTSVTITEPSQILATVTSTSESCTGDCDGTAIISTSGGTAPYAFLWASGNTSDTMVALCPGEYFATISDAHGCGTIAAVAIGPGMMVLPAITGDTFVCFGESGELQVNQYDSYLWNTGDTSKAISWNEAGIYSVTVTINGCIGGDTIEVNPGNELILMLDVTEGNIIKALAMGGQAPYNYLWSDGSTTDSLQVTVSGTNIVTVSDSDNCSVTDSLSVNISSIFESGKESIRVYPNPTESFIYINLPLGVSTEAISVFAISGTQVLAPIVNNVAIDVSDLFPGTYFLRINTDKKFYTATFSKM
ncbi:MAG: BspA family leucine-rich repeat surface protein [Saprospiraceae bacterium]|nr:BspA family leucine-rich repeat surface protein [Candidatus Brachybacter algidus]